jgi:hypothetical protein
MEALGMYLHWSNAIGMAAFIMALVVFFGEVLPPAIRPTPGFRLTLAKVAFFAYLVTTPADAIMLFKGGGANAMLGLFVDFLMLYQLKRYV